MFVAAGVCPRGYRDFPVLRGVINLRQSPSLVRFWRKLDLLPRPVQFKRNS